jgi:hypothetical protein
MERAIRSKLVSPPVELDAQQKLAFELRQQIHQNLPMNGNGHSNFVFRYLDCHGVWCFSAQKKIFGCLGDEGWEIVNIKHADPHEIVKRVLETIAIHDRRENGNE